MTVERFQKIRQLFEVVLEQEPERREQFLQETSSGDQELVQEVRLMLQARAESPGFLDQPAAIIEAEAILTSASSRVFQRGTIVAGRFEILGLLGRGGMGEVYHARDHKLDRSVALKVIAGSGTRSRRERFLQEARAASALNHPNIVTVYDIAEENGVEYIAMEYVAGAPLVDVIAGRLPLEATLSYALQIADALAAAHAAGIVHRDVKPGNILITANGTAKILDFGLAKLTGIVEPLETVASESNLVSSQGAIVGTVAYMSPEQAEGKPVDARSDIFSFGCVLYEMLTSRRPFEGESRISTLTAMLHREPRAIRELAPDLPLEVGRVVMRCLAKDPIERPRSMSDVKMLLAPITTSSSAATESARHRIAFVSRGWIWFLFIPSCISAVLLGYSWTTTSSKSVLTIETVSPFTSTGTSRKTAISPDGRHVAYVLGSPGRQSLRVRQANAAADIEIVPTADVAYFGLTFAPDGNHLFYGVIENSTNASTLYRIPTSGGPSQAVARKLDSPITFSPSGSEYAFVRENASDGKSLMIVAATSGGRERVIASQSLPEYFDYPTWSPRGDRIAVSIVGVNDKARLATVDPKGNNRVEDMPSHWRRISGIAWLKNGFLVSGRAPGEGLLHLWQVGAKGARHRLTPDLSDYWGLGITEDLRTIVAVQERSFSNLWRIPIASAKKAEQLVEGVTRYSRFGLMPDGRLIYEEQAGEVRRLVLSDQGKIVKPLTASGKSYLGMVCPDKQTLLYSWHIAGPPTLWKMNTDGSGAVAIGPETSTTNIACSSDSRWAIYTAPGSGKYSTLWKANLLDGRTLQLTTKPSEHPALSPDGRRIAFFYVDETLETHQRPPDLALISSDGGRIQQILPVPATVHKAAGIKWTPDGQSVTYVTSREGTAEIWVHPVSGGTPTAILRFPRELIHSFEWPPDGHDLYVSRGPSVYDVVLMSIR